MKNPTRTQHETTHLSQFRTLSEALDAAHNTQTGMNFYGGRGELTEVLFYRDLAREARSVGGRLLAKGTKPGDRIGIIAETEANFVRAFMGCLYAHLIPCPLPLPFAFSSASDYVDRLKPILDVAQVTTLIVPDEYSALIYGQLNAQAFRFCGSLSALDGEPDELPDTEPSTTDIAYLQFSSGTTSTPKGVAISHHAMMSNLRGMIDQSLRLGPDDRGVSWLPFYHDMGLVGCVLLPIAAHMSLDYLATRDFIRRPALWITMMNRAKATLTYAPTFGYELVSRRMPKSEDLDLSSWRIAGVGGDMIKPESLRNFAENYSPFGFSSDCFLPSYGMAEMTLAATFGPLGEGIETQHLDLTRLEHGAACFGNPDDENTREFVSCGTVLPGHEVLVKKASGEIAADFEVGTVFLKGPSMMSGYFDNPHHTATMLDKNGWLNTGDLGYLNQGWLTLTGRAKDLIIINGRNIWPQDIEWSVERMIHDAREGRVVAFECPFIAEGREQHICVVLECRFSDETRRASLRSDVTRLIKSKFSVNPTVILSPSGRLPKTSSGKLSRSKARAMYFDGAFDC